MSAYLVAEKLITTLHEAGFTAYFAGGWVRDFLMDHPSNDIDIATDASVEDVQRLFPKTIPLGVSFGIVVVIEEPYQFEVAEFRKDLGYCDGRRPAEIARATPEEDAKRRDFTINGMFYDPLRHQILDYVEGMRDLERKIIRAIGNPHERFLEDRLRMIRAVRYASRFDFAMETATVEAILDHAEDLFPAVAIERVWNELSKMATSVRFPSALVILQRLRLLPIIFPMLRDISTAILTERLQRLPHFPKNAPLIAKILELFPKASLQERQALCDYFKLPNKIRAFVAFYHRALILLVEPGPPTDLHTFAHLYAHPDFPICFAISLLYLPLEKREAFLEEHKVRQEKLRFSIAQLQSKRPFLRSSALRAAGIPNGKKMGLLLKEAEKIAINEGLLRPEHILERLKTLPLWPEL